MNWTTTRRLPTARHPGNPAAILPPGFAFQVTRLGIRSALFAASLAWGVCSTPAADGGARRFTAELDTFYLSGDYGGTETTDIWYVPLILRAWGERHEFSLVVPYLRIDGPASVVVGDRGGVPSSAEVSGGPEKRDGPGDLVVRGELFFLTGDGRRKPWLSGLGRIKLPTADEQEGLGTGEPDYTAGISYTQPCGEVVSAFLDLTYKLVGDPEGTAYDNTTGVVLGLSARFGGTHSAFLMVDREDSIVPGLPAGESLTAGGIFQWKGGFRLSASIFAGLSDSREDVGGMIGVGRTWDVPAPAPTPRRRTGG